ncbi:MAG: hypothetical protein PHE78_07740 [Candidatus Gastranaerophilales bacterium]|nr:hypothetical protein [Candidatus Gastranaerophilales bacterium]
MVVTLNTAISTPRASKVQKTNFKALPIEKIIKNDSYADMFRTDVSKGKYKKTEENVSHLTIAYKRTKDLGVKFFLEDVAKKWGVKFA